MGNNDYCIDPEQVGYIFPNPEINTDSESCHRKGRCLFWHMVCHAACFMVVAMFVVVGCTFALTWYFDTPSKWDGINMERFRHVMLKQVKALMVTANKSIHDPVARQLLRNLSTDSKTCYTPNCIHAGLSMLESMNFAVDPCDDFYQFACGSWLQMSEPLTTLPGAFASDHFLRIDDKFAKAIQKILEEPLSTDFEPLRQTQRLYSMCKDIDNLERIGLGTLWELIDKYGGWPLLNHHIPHIKWNNTFDDWLKLAGDLQRLQYPSVLGLQIQQHPTNISENVIYILPPRTYLSKEYLTNRSKYSKIHQEYRVFISSVAAEFVKDATGKDPDWEHLETDVEEMITFEAFLANLSTAHEANSHQKIIKKRWLFSLLELQLQTDLLTPKSSRNKISWMRFLDQVFSTSKTSPKPEDRVFIDGLPVPQLTELLARTKPETLANYLMWRLVLLFTTGTTQRLRTLTFNFSIAVKGMKHVPERPLVCVNVARDLYGLVLGMKMVRDFSEPASKKEVEEMADNIKASMKSMLGQKHLGSSLFPWINVAKKLDTLKSCVGFPTVFSNISAVKQYYDTLRVSDDNDDYLKRYMSLRFWSYDKTLDTLREPFDPDCWTGPNWIQIGEVYAFYDSSRNSINFPVGLLQAPFFRRNVPMSLNYGALGAVIGHEIAHSVNFEAWVKAGLIPFLQEYWDCLGRFYSGFHLPQRPINGIETRPENLADHMGLAASYWAYRKLQDHNHYRDQSVVGFDLFSADQMFYLSFAHMWCMDGPEEWLADVYGDSTHTPGIYRVLGSLQNSADFARVWSCPVGSPMNPEEKCNTDIHRSDPRYIFNIFG